jgi:hypothetical protein
VGEEFGVELVVRHDEEEEDADRGREEADYQKEELPGFDGDGVAFGAGRDAVGYCAAEDLDMLVVVIH